MEEQQQTLLTYEEIINDIQLQHNEITNKKIFESSVNKLEAQKKTVLIEQLVKENNELKMQIEQLKQSKSINPTGKEGKK